MLGHSLSSKVKDMFSHPQSRTSFLEHDCSLANTNIYSIPFSMPFIKIWSLSSKLSSLLPCRFTFQRPSLQ